MIEYAERVCITATLSAPSLNLGLEPEHFTTKSHRLIWKAIQSAGREIPDVVTWLERETGENWTHAILAIVNDSFEDQNASQWAEKLRENHRHRQAARLAQNLIADLSDGQGDRAVHNAILKLKDLTETKTDLPTIAEAALAGIAGGRSGKTSALVGLPRVDMATGGLHAGDLVVVGARTGVGKTAFMIQLASHNASKGIPVGIISGEQCAGQIGLRCLAHVGTTSIAQIRAGHANWDELEAQAEGMRGYPCWVSDKSAPTLAHVEGVARSWVRDHGIRVLFVDYIQRMTGDKRLPKHEQVGDIAKGLKTLAVDLGIPVVALAQLNRQAAEGAPTISQLKDSGQIEQEADQIYLIHAADPDYNAVRYEVSLMLEKNRHGPVGYFKLMWERAKMRYNEMERS